jgi:hypothetical protein
MTEGFKSMGKSALESLKTIKGALIATGIGVFLVALGTIYAYWDDIKGVVDGITPELKKRVEESPGLTLHYSYATWNGPGFFQKFAKSMSNKLKNNPNMSEKELIDSGIADRSQTGLFGKDKVAAAMRDKNLINTIS